MTLRIFVGSDDREAVGLQVFLRSLEEHASEPVALHVITERMGTQSDGSNAFTKSRFLVPAFCNYEGFGIWLDGADMLLLSDPAELLQLIDTRSAVQVVKHDYVPRSSRKYLGTDLETDNVPYPRKNWSSVMVFACAACRVLTPRYVRESTGQHLHRLGWVPDQMIGTLPAEWNWLDEYGENDKAKLIHYTNGIPGFTAYRNAPRADEWWATLKRAQRGLQNASGQA